jgi:predicted naringenin-chalcone synthase
VVLLCAVELCSLHLQYDWNEEAAVAHALFGDGAAAVVMSADDSDTDRPWTLAATGSCLVPASEDYMSWRIGDHGFVMGLSPRVPDRIGESLRPWLAAWLEHQGHGLDGIASWAVHPGGPRILSAVEAALELGRDDLSVSRDRLAICGNMSSPTVLFILDDLRRALAPRPCVALAFGPGLAVEAALFT